MLAFGMIRRVFPPSPSWPEEAESSAYLGTRDTCAPPSHSSGEGAKRWPPYPARCLIWTAEIHSSTVSGRCGTAEASQIGVGHMDSFASSVGLDLATPKPRFASPRLHVSHSLGSLHSDTFTFIWEKTASHQAKFTSNLF